MLMLWRGYSLLVVMALSEPPDTIGLTPRLFYIKNWIMNQLKSFETAEDLLSQIFSQGAPELCSWGGFSNAVRFGRLKLNIVNHTKIFDEVVSNNNNRVFNKYSGDLFAVGIIVFTIYTLIYAPFWNILIVAGFFYLLRITDITFWYKKYLTFIIITALLVLINTFIDISFASKLFMIFLFVGRFFTSSVYYSFVTEAISNDPNVFLYLMANNKIVSIYDKETKNKYL